MATDFEDAKTSTFDSDSRKTIQLQQRNSGSDWEEQLTLQASERFSSEPPGPWHAVNSLFIGSSKICMPCCIATSSSGLWHAKGCLLLVERCASCSRMQCSLRRSLCVRSSVQVHFCSLAEAVGARRTTHWGARLCVPDACRATDSTESSFKTRRGKSPAGKRQTHSVECFRSNSPASGSKQASAYFNPCLY